MINFVLFIIIWLFLNFCFFWKMSWKEIRKEIYYYIILMILIFIYTILINTDIVTLFFVYPFNDFVYHTQFYNPFILFSTLSWYFIIPIIIIFIKLKISKKYSLKYFLLNLLIFYLTLLWSFFIWYYTWLVIYEKPFCFC